jgi:hypothetical protein
MDRIEAQQMGVGLDRAEIVNPDHFDILAAGLGDRPEHIAADAAKPVNCDPDCHSVSPKASKSRVLRPFRPIFGLAGDLSPSISDAAMHHNPECSDRSTLHQGALTQRQ